MQYSKKIKIGDFEYTVNQYPASKGVRYLAGLTRLLGVPLAHFFAGSKEGVEKVLPVAIQALASRLDEDEVLDLIKNLMSTTTYEGQTVDQIFDEHFRGRIGVIFKLTYEIVRYQFEDFLSVAVAAGMKEMKKPQSPSPITSNG